MALTTNLVAYYKLDESSGNATDTVGGFTLTNNGTTPFASALINNGADYGTANSSKYFRGSNNLGIDGGAITISTWVKIQTEIASSHWGIALQGSATSQVNYIISYDYNGGTRRLRFNREKQAVSDNYTDATVTLGTSSWHHIVLRYDGTNLSGWLDGAQVANNLATSGNGTTTALSQFMLGYEDQSGMSGYASMYQDETAVYSRALSAYEIRQLYNYGIGIAHPMTDPRPVFSQIATGVSNNGSSTTHTYTGNGLASVDSVVNGIGYVMFDSGGLSIDPTSVTWGGSAMTKLQTVNQTTRGNTQSVWYILNPSSGAVSIVDNFASANSPNMIWGVYAGIKQTAPEASNATSNTSSSISNTITTGSFADSLVASFSCNNFGTATASTDTTGRILGVNSIGDRNLPVSATTSVTQAYSGGGSNWTLIMASMAKATSATDVTVSPAVKTVTFSIHAYTVTAERFVTVTPTTPSATFTIPNPTSSGGAGVAGTVQTATFSIPAYTVSANGSITVNANLQTATFSIPAYTVSIVSDVTVSPSLQVCTFTIPAYTVTLITGVTVTPSVQSLTLSIPSYRVIADYWDDTFVQPTNNWNDKFAQPTNNWNDKY